MKKGLVFLHITHTMLDFKDRGLPCPTLKFTVLGTGILKKFPNIVIYKRLGT